MIFIRFKKMQVEHTKANGVSEARAQRRGSTCGVCAPAPSAPLVRLCQHPGDTCGCVSVSSPRRGDLHNTGLLPAGCPATSPRNTGLLPSPEPSCLHIPGRLFHQNPGHWVSQALHPPVCAGLRTWWLHCEGRKMPSPGTPVLSSQDTPVSPVHTCESPTLSPLVVSPSCLVSSADSGMLGATKAALRPRTAPQGAHPPWLPRARRALPPGACHALCVLRPQVSSAGGACR